MEYHYPQSPEHGRLAFAWKKPLVGKLALTPEEAETISKLRGELAAIDQELLATDPKRARERVGNLRERIDGCESSEEARKLSAELRALEVGLDHSGEVSQALHDLKKRLVQVHAGPIAQRLLGEIETIFKKRQGEIMRALDRLETDFSCDDMALALLRRRLNNTFCAAFDGIEAERARCAGDAGANLIDRLELAGPTTWPTDPLKFEL